MATERLICEAGFCGAVGSLKDVGPVGSDASLDYVVSRDASAGDQFPITTSPSNTKVPGLNHTHQVPLPPHFKVLLIMKL
jgi:hypothetical protein